MKKLSRLMLSAAAMVLTLAAGTASAQIVKNGSFEDQIAASPFQTLAAGSTFLTSWRISGSVDLINGYWPAQDGRQSVDLDGNSFGILQQAVNLVGGQAYSLSFWLSGNPDGAPDPKTLNVSVGGLLSENVSIAKPASIAAMVWTQFSFDFTAVSDGTYNLMFDSTSAGGCCYGAAIDNVSITPVPEPETYAMLLAGLAGLAGFAARRRRSLNTR